MKNFSKIILVAIIVLLNFGFNNPTENTLYGTYGVSENNPSQIELILKKDNTFEYRDFSNPAKRIDVSGIWELKNKFVLLKNHHSEFSFHDKWKIETDKETAKSRKGILFYTLMKK